MSDAETATLKLAITVHKHKSHRGKILGYSAEYYGLSCTGDTKLQAIAPDIQAIKNGHRRWLDSNETPSEALARLSSDQRNV